MVPLNQIEASLSLNKHNFINLRQVVAEHMYIFARGTVTSITSETQVPWKDICIKFKPVENLQNNGQVQFC